MTFQSQHISVSINRPADQVYEFSSKPENLPQWAAGLSGSIQNIHGDWIATSPMGRVKVKFSPTISMVFWITRLRCHRV
ncbi:MAG TPA: hypothetical protein PKE45_18250 [Caldilineaceae bacterium]|nr:hypothetical protein [Caldilineaceae bacterium]